MATFNNSRYMACFEIKGMYLPKTIYILSTNKCDKIVHCVNREGKEKKEEASPNSIEQWHYQL